jgi:hypothetical protein
VADKHPQAYVVAFRALRLLDAPVPHFDGERHCPQSHRIRGIRPGSKGGLNQAFRPVGERGEI